MPIPRVRISVYKYKGIHTPEQETAFGQFTDIIHDKIINLAQSLAGHGEKYQYLNQLQYLAVSGADGSQLEFTGTINELQNFYKATHTLEILTGRVRKENGLYSVRSRVFLGSLGEALAEGMVSLDLKIDDSEFDHTTDTHSMVTLYALAMDAKRLGYPRDVVFMYLGEAFLRARDVPDDLEGVPALKAAIDAALTAMKQETGTADGGTPQ